MPPFASRLSRRFAGVVVASAAVLWAVTACVAGTGGLPAPTDGRDEQQPIPLTEIPLVPDSGVALGIYYGDGDPESTDAAIGATPLINLTYFGWEDAWTTSPVLTADTARGQTSLVNWEPFGVDFADIVGGRFDDMLTQRATEAAALASPVFLDFAAEMNEEEGWGGHDPELYKSTYQHIHDIFDGRDGGNVVWVWAPNNVDSADAPPAMDYYPGDAYVDWTGIDGYNWGTSDPDFTWQSFKDVFQDVYDDLHTLGKPIIIGETASAEEGGSKPDWVTHIIPILKEQFPDIRAVVWFDVDKERDWRIRSTPDTISAFHAFASDPFIRTATR